MFFWEGRVAKWELLEEASFSKGERGPYPDYRVKNVHYIIGTVRLLSPNEWWIVNSERLTRIAS
jgi:hypothetical protein